MDGLAARPADAAALLVEVRDPRAPTRAERSALVERCRRANMAIYASAAALDDPSIPLRLAAELGLAARQAPVPAEDDGIACVPWHTAGYGNPAPTAVGSWVMHCAHAGPHGEYALLDPRLACLLLREEGAAFVDALMQPDAFAIGASEERRAVFAVDAQGALHMRFTERRHALRWKCDALVSEAAARLRRLLDSHASCIVRARLEGGMGVVANNVLLSRPMAADARQARVLRACFHERIAGTGGA